MKTWEQSLKDAKVGDEIIVHAKDGSVEYILELKMKEERKMKEPMCESCGAISCIHEGVCLNCGSGDVAEGDEG